MNTCVCKSITHNTRMRFLNAGGGTLFPSIRKQDAAGDPDGIVPFAQAAVAAGIGGVCAFPGNSVGELCCLYAPSTATLNPLLALALAPAAVLTAPSCFMHSSRPTFPWGRTSDARQSVRHYAPASSTSKALPNRSNHLPRLSTRYIIPLFIFLDLNRSGHKRGHILQVCVCVCAYVCACYRA